MLSVPESTSTKTGRAPTAKIMFPVAAHVMGVVTTSSPGPTPAARSARCRPAVAELIATACAAPTVSAKASSKRVTRGPLVNHPDRRQAVTSSISCGPIDGRDNGRKSVRTRLLLRPQPLRVGAAVPGPPDPPARLSIAGRRARAKERDTVAAAVPDLLGVRRTHHLAIGAQLDDPPFDPPRKRSRGCRPALAAPWGGALRRSAAGGFDPSGARQEPLHPVRSAPARHELLPLHLHPLEAPAERALPRRDRSLDRAHHDLVRPPPRRAPERGAGGRHRGDRGRDRPRIHDLKSAAVRSTSAACPGAECRAWRSGTTPRRACSS